MAITTSTASTTSVRSPKTDTPRYAAPHGWNLTPTEAIALQKQLRAQLRPAPLSTPVRWIAGVDSGYEDQGRTARAAVALFRYPELTLEETQLATEPVRMPYIPGLLTFRELPVVLKALNQLRGRPDLLLCDGHGYAHPRRFGIACHLGLVTGIPTIGIGKSRLVGRHEEPGKNKGDWTPLLDHDEVIARVLRTRVGVKPIYVSVGDKVTLDDGIEWVLRCTPRYRLPEPIRAADRLASDRDKRRIARLVRLASL